MRGAAAEGDGAQVGRDRDRVELEGALDRLARDRDRALLPGVAKHERVGGDRVAHQRGGQPLRGEDLERVPADRVGERGLELAHREL
ncbi:MAG: hypothetical protein ACK559_02275, partial [bacterium]